MYMYIYIYICICNCIYLGPGALGRGPWPRAQDMVYTWRVDFIFGDEFVEELNICIYLYIAIYIYSLTNWLELGGD